MSQHDYDILNQSGAAFRADLNNALSAIVTLNAGASAPTFTFANMWWADTTTSLLKKRNNANTLWVTLGDLDTANLGLADLGSVGTFTAGMRGEITTLTDAASIAINLDDSNNFTVTLGGNRTLANPTGTPVAGQSGVIIAVQDGTGSRTLAYGSQYKFENGSAPTLTVAQANAIDVLSYFVKSSTEILISPSFNWS